VANVVGPFLEGYGEAPNHESLIHGVPNMAKNLPLKYIDNIEYDAATKSIFGMSLNWDPFKYGGN
jgi:hypothetical protein